MSVLIDLVNQVLSVNALVPQVLAATAQGSSQDFANGEISTGAIVEVGAFGANSTTLNVQIEESADGSTSWTAISGMVCTVTTSNVHTVLRGLRSKRYLRANAVTLTGATPAVACSVSVLAQKRYSAGSGVSQSGVSRSPST